MATSARSSRWTRLENSAAAKKPLQVSRKAAAAGEKLGNVVRKPANQSPQRPPLRQPNRIVAPKVVSFLPPERPRTKKPRLHGKALRPDQKKYLECMVRELECTLERSRLALQEKTDKICRNADLWYDKIIRTVPKEILKRPFREVWDSAVPIINMSATSSVSAASPSLPDSEVPLDPKPSTAVRQRVILASAKAKKTASQRRSAISKKKASDEALGVPKSTKRARKVSVRVPILPTRTTTGVPIVTPKFDIRKRPASARPVRQGEILLSLSGSPVEAKTSGVPIHVHVKNGQVVKLTTHGKSLNELCKAIKTLCEKL